MENTIVMTLARMPFCTAGEISGLLGLDEDGVRGCVRSMREYGVCWQPVRRTAEWRAGAAPLPSRAGSRGS